MWPNPPETADLVTFTEETLNEKLHFLCSVLCKHPLIQTDKDVKQSIKAETWTTFSTGYFACK